MNMFSCCSCLLLDPMPIQEQFFFFFLSLIYLFLVQVVQIYIKSMLECYIYRFEALLQFLCCQGFQVETHMRIILAAYAGLIMRMHTCSCVRMIMPRNPNFFDFVSNFTCNTSVLDYFSYICGFNILFHMVIIRLLFHMFKLGFVLCFLVLMP